MFRNQSHCEGPKPVQGGPSPGVSDLRVDGAVVPDSGGLRSGSRGSVSESTVTRPTRSPSLRVLFARLRLPGPNHVSPSQLP